MPEVPFGTSAFEAPTLVTITGCLENCVGAESQDIAMVPARKGERVGFNVHVGGKMGSGGYRRADALDVFVEPARAAEVAATIVCVYRDHGPREARNRSRFAFLIDDWGVARVRAAVEETFGAPLEPAGEDARGETRTDHIGIYRQKDGRSYVGLVVPDKTVDSVCPYCGVGCQLTYHIKENKILFVQGKEGGDKRKEGKEGKDRREEGSIVLKDVDTNNDGRATLAELQAALEKAKQGGGDKKDEGGKKERK